MSGMLQKEQQLYFLFLHLYLPNIFALALSQIFLLEELVVSTWIMKEKNLRPLPASATTNLEKFLPSVLTWATVSGGDKKRWHDAASAEDYVNVWHNDI